jgi:hypothetical protein
MKPVNSNEDLVIGYYHEASGFGNWAGHFIKPLHKKCFRNLGMMEMKLEDLKTEKKWNYIMLLFWMTLGIIAGIINKNFWISGAIMLLYILISFNLIQNLYYIYKIEND